MRVSANKYYVILMLLFWGLEVFSQNYNPDSLLQKLQTENIDTVKLSILNKLTNLYINNEQEKANAFANEAIVIAEKINYNGIELANSYNAKGILQYYESSYDSALYYYMLALKIREGLGDKIGIAVAYNNIGMIFQRQKNLSMALDYYLKALTIRAELNDRRGMASSNQSIGNIYLHQDKDSLAMVHYLEAKFLFNEINDESGLGILYGNIANAYMKKNAFNEALKLYLKALKLAEKYNNKQIALSHLNNIAHLYSTRNEYQNVITYSIRSLNIANEMKTKKSILVSYQNLAAAYEALNNFKDANNYYKLYAATKDTIFNEQSSKQITEMQTKYETEKKEQQITLLNKEGEIKALSIKKQKTVIYSVVGGLFLVIIFAVFIFRSLNITKRQKHIISKQKGVVEQKNEELSTKNKQIADSIDYAQNIQEAILPSAEKIEELLPNSFIFFKPKDVVSGDFYWLQQVTNKKNEIEVLFAVIDCTGHGVPGAFVSLMAYNFLEKVVNEHAIYHPEKILNELNKEVIKLLRKDGQITSTKYGMDMALVSWNKNTGKIIYAGARNPLYIISESKLTQIEANRMSIGSTTDYSFVQHEIQLKKEDMLYLFTDGFADQKGGADGKKFYYPPFRELLEKNSDKPAIEQKSILQKTFIQWKGENQQIDDVCIIGVRV